MCAFDMLQACLAKYRAGGRGQRSIYGGIWKERPPPPILQAQEGLQSKRLGAQSLSMLVPHAALPLLWPLGHVLLQASCWGESF